MNQLYDTILDPILTIAFLAFGSAGVQATKLSMLLGAFALACNTVERLVVGIAGILFHAVL